MQGSIQEKKMTLTKGTKFFLDIMFYGGIVVTLGLPFILKFLGQYWENVAENYVESLIIYFVLGVAAVILLQQLRRIFSTVLSEDCFVQDNVTSLKRMGDVSFFIAAMSVVRCFVYVTLAMVVVILVFIIAGFFSKVLSLVFEQAVKFKEENDLTI